MALNLVSRFRWNSNWKALTLKDGSVRSIWTYLTANTTNTKEHDVYHTHTHTHTSTNGVGNRLFLHVFTCACQCAIAWSVLLGGAN